MADPRAREWWKSGRPPDLPPLLRRRRRRRGRDRGPRRHPAAAGPHRVEDLNDPERRFELTAEDIRLLNPSTRTCPREAGIATQARRLRGRARRRRARRHLQPRNGFVEGENLFTTRDGDDGSLDQNEITAVARRIEPEL